METKADEELNIKSKEAMEAFQALFSDEKARRSKYKTVIAVGESGAFW